MRTKIISCVHFSCVLFTKYFHLNVKILLNIKNFKVILLNYLDFLMLAIYVFFNILVSSNNVAMTIFVNKVLTLSDVALRIINERSYVFHILRFLIQMGNLLSGKFVPTYNINVCLLECI